MTVQFPSDLAGSDSDMTPSKARRERVVGGKARREASPAARRAAYRAVRGSLASQQVRAQPREPTKRESVDLLSGEWCV